MGNLLDYLYWRGDLPLARDPFNDADNVLCALLAYIDFREFVPEDPGTAVPFAETVQAFLDRIQGKNISLGALMTAQVFDAAREMASCVRFSKTKMTAYCNVCREDALDPQLQVQWAALTFLFEDGTMYISFAGTDDTLISWKEDFNMAVYATIPSQKEAAEYVRRVMRAHPEYHKVYVGGHSKGGNLAIYSAAKCGGDLQGRIARVYANDAPGFHKTFLSDPDYLAVRDRVLCILPDQSFVGLLLYHDAKRKVIKSAEKSFRQHDCLTWQVKGGALEAAEGISGEALILRKTVETWFDQMTQPERQAFVESIYKALTGLEAKTLTDLVDGRTLLLRSYRALPQEERQIIRGMVKKFFSSGKTVYSAAVQSDKEREKAAVKKKKQTAKNTFVTRMDGATLSLSAGKKKKNGK